jgi:hypothetical protein
MYCLFICLYYLFLVAIGADTFENLQELDIQDFEQQQAGEQDK